MAGKSKGPASKTTKKGGKPFSINGEGGKIMFAVFDSGIVDGTTTLKTLYDEHADTNEDVAELQEYNQNLLRTAFTKHRNDTYNTRAAVESKSKYDVSVVTVF